MLEELSASGESDAVFARRTGVAPHRIQYWRKRLGEEPEVARERAVAGFVPLRVVETEAEQPARATRRVEARLGGGARLVFTGDWDRASLRPWLAALGADDAE